MNYLYKKCSVILDLPKTNMPYRNSTDIKSTMLELVEAQPHTRTYVLQMSRVNVIQRDKYVKELIHYGLLSIKDHLIYITPKGITYLDTWRKLKQLE